jgi:hypothetical protein
MCPSLPLRERGDAVAGLRRRLLGRLPYGCELTLNGKDAIVVLRPGKQTWLKLIEDAVTITLREDHAAELAALLQPHAGLYPVPGLSSVAVQVVKTEVTDSEGRVVDVVE